MVNLESPQARWAEECCKGGNCPVCNPPNEEPWFCKRCDEQVDGGDDCPFCGDEESSAPEYSEEDAKADAADEELHRKRNEGGDL